jgi:hypothetical protein
VRQIVEKNRYPLQHVDTCDCENGCGLSQGTAMIMIFVPMNLVILVMVVFTLFMIAMMMMLALMTSVILKEVVTMKRLNVILSAALPLLFEVMISQGVL